MLVGESHVFKNGKANTLYVSIPSRVAQDSAFTIKEGDVVEVKFDEVQNAVVIKPKSLKKKSERSKGSTSD